MEKEKKKNKTHFSVTDKKPSMKKRNRAAAAAEEEDEESSPPKKDPKLCPKLDSFVELNLDTPLPFEWQRCLDIKSGEIHFYNTMTHMRTARDPRRLTPPPTLDLELNLMCEPSGINAAGDDRAAGGDEREMVATVCARCHLLVMMWKASPSCPNCRFEHPPGLQSPPPQPPLKNKPKTRFLSCRGLRG